MASNPMQRKSRNSFLLGMVLTLLITGVIIALLFLQLKQKTEQLNAELNAKVIVYTLTQNVKSGQELTQDMFAKREIHKDSIPSNATSLGSVIDTWFLQTKDGTMINTDEYGIYLNKPDSILEVTEDAKYKIFGKDKENKEESKKEVSSKDEIVQDTDGAYIVDTSNSDKITRVYQEDLTGSYYVYKLDDSSMRTGNNVARVKEYLELQNVPVLAKVEMNANTVITRDFVVQSDEVVTDDTREQEYNMVVLPVDLMTDDYVDIRLMTPAGQDFIVVSKAKVNIPKNSDGSYVTDTMRVNLREDEILFMSSAIVEAYGLLGSKLYATKYVEPGLQQPSVPTYTPNAAVIAQIDPDLDGKIDNPNIVEEATTGMAARFSEKAKETRNKYLQSIINNSEDYTSNIQGKVEEDAKKQSTTRQKYLESLNY